MTLVMGLIIIILFIFGFHYLNYLKYRNSSYYEITQNSYFDVVLDSGKVGEYNVSKELQSFNYRNCKVLYNIYIPIAENKWTEIDILLITPIGLIVIESKNFIGWIFGNEIQKYWTQTHKGSYGSCRKEHFYNPIRQNNFHIINLRNHLKLNVKFYSIIAFSDNCTLKKVQYSSKNVHVVYRNQVKNTIESLFTNQECLNIEQIQSIYNKLLPYSNPSNYVKLQHINNLSKKNF